MEEETYQKPRRKLSFTDHRQSQPPSFTQFYSNNHSSNYLQLAIDNLNELIKESEQQILNEQQLIINEENNKLNKIQNLQNEINHIQTNIDSLNNEIEKLTSGTYEMLVRQSQGALSRHNQVLKESIEHINHVLRKRSIVNDSSLDQLKKELINQQAKLFFIRNQLDIDHNKLTTNLSLLKECQQQRNQFEQIKLKKQVDLQNVQQIQSKFYFSFFFLFSIFRFSI
jgi:DNA repair exonuclease SbcCD ATPase subunit